MVRFGPYEYRDDTGELRKHGIRIGLQSQPARILTALLAKPGEVVSRQELFDLLWPRDLHVDFENGLNSSVRKLRQALNDDAAQPLYIETLPKVGYRFIAPVEKTGPPVPPVTTADPEPESVAAALAEPPAVAIQPSAARVPFRWWILGLGAVAALTAGILLSRRGTTEVVADTPVRHTVVQVKDGFRVARLFGNPVAISPDGRMLAYIAGNESNRWLFLRPLDGDDAIAVSGSEGAGSVAFAPDGQTVAFATQRGIHRYRWALKTMEPLIPAEQGNGPLDLVWGPDGSIWHSGKFSEAGRVAGGVWSWSSSSGTSKRQPLRELTPQPPGAVEWMAPASLSPDGAGLFVTIVADLGRRTVLVDPRDGTAKLVSKRSAGWRPLPNGQAAFFWQDRIWGGHYDELRHSLKGAPAVLVPGVAGHWAGADADFSKDGTLVYVPAASETEYQLTWVDLRGNETPLPMPPSAYRPLDLSHDGARLLMSKRDGDTWSLWQFDLRSGKSERLVDGLWGWDLGAAWCDAETIVYSASSHAEELGKLSRKRVREPGPGTRLFEGGLGHHPQHCLGDKILYSDATNPATSSDIWLAHTKGGQPELVGGHPRSESSAALSPDSRWIAYSGAMLWVRQADLKGASMVLRQDPSFDPAWSADGSKLYFRSGEQMWEVPFSAGKAGERKALFRVPGIGASWWIRSTFFDPLGRRFLVSRPVINRVDGRQINVVTNWFREVGQKLPH